MQGTRGVDAFPKLPHMWKTGKRQEELRQAAVRELDHAGTLGQQPTTPAWSRRLNTNATRNAKEPRPTSDDVRIHAHLARHAGVDDDGVPNVDTTNDGSEVASERPRTGETIAGISRTTKYLWSAGGVSNTGTRCHLNAIWQAIL